MYRIYLAAVDLLPAVLLLIPIYWALNAVYFHNTIKSTFCCLFSCYLAVIYVLVGLPNVTYIRPELNVNLIPIVGMVDDLKNSILNVCLFVPLGLALPVGWKTFQKRRCAILFGGGMSLSIEILQILTFRATDVNDVITNTLGALLGYCGGMALLKRYPRINSLFNEDKSCDLFVVLSVVLAVMFFIYPFVSSALWDMILA